MSQFIKNFLAKMGIEMVSGQKEVDVVCGMRVSTQSQYKMSYEGKGYYFCSSHCQQFFEKEPKKYIRK